jgi:2-polyprenyl-3-methyl-5-hydroxy-6-metoxy-1,4-benzoquinol methylase
MFHKRILTDEWNEIRFREWVSAAAIREFDQRYGLDTPAYHFEKARYSVEHIVRIERMTRALRNAGSVRLVDFGSSWGKFILLASEFGFEACGIERAPEVRQFARDQGQTVFPDPESARLSVPEGFHATTLFQVLEHVDHPLETLRALREIMVPGGILVIEVPNCEGIAGIKTPSDYRNIHPLEHINAFTPRTLQQIAERAGFRRIRPEIVHVTSDFRRVLKREVKRVASWIMKPSTHQYFRR